MGQGAEATLGETRHAMGGRWTSAIPQESSSFFRRDIGLHALARRLLARLSARAG